MPYSRKAKYKHNRQRPPGQFQKSTMRTVPVSHIPESQYRGKKFRKKGVKAITGKLKKSKKWKVQSFLVPKWQNALKQKKYNYERNARR